MPGNAPAARKRPRDRRAQILQAAAQAFSRRGYHAVGIDEIAGEVGISGPALYRHYPSKYALFAAAAEHAALRLVTAAAAADDPAADPARRLAAVTTALIDTTVEHRRENAIYRWERRYLAPADRARLRGIYDRMNNAVAQPLRELRPDCPDADTDLLAAAALSTIGSISVHRTALPATRLRRLLAELCGRLVRVELPPAPAGPAPDDGGTGLAATAKRERLLIEAIRVFGRRGFNEAGVDEIGAAAGMTASSVYRYYPSKADLLAAAFHRAGDRVRQAITDALAESRTPAEALNNVAERYVSLTFAGPDGLALYFAEFANLPHHEQATLRERQRQNVDELVHLVEQLHPGDPAAARFRVHAALGMVLDLGRLVHFDTRPQQRARVTRLMTTVLTADIPNLTRKQES